MALGVMAAAGCNEKEPQKDPTPEPTPAIQSFEISVDAVTKKTVTYSVTPELLDKEYIAVVTTAESLAGLEDEAVVEHVYDEIKATAASAGLTFAEKMSAIAAKGALQGVVVDGLAVNTEYAVVVSELTLQITGRALHSLNLRSSRQRQWRLSAAHLMLPLLSSRTM